MVEAILNEIGKRLHRYYGFWWQTEQLDPGYFARLHILSPLNDLLLGTLYAEYHSKDDLVYLIRDNNQDVYLGLFESNIELWGYIGGIMMEAHPKFKVINRIVNEKTREVEEE